MKSPREAITKALHEHAPHGHIGLADNSASGEPFRCGTCEYFNAGTCHNPDPKLHGRKVQNAWCCNLYDRTGMKIIEA